jgi:Na+/proline symporter
MEADYGALMSERKEVTLSYAEAQNEIEKENLGKRLYNIDAKSESIRQDVKSLITTVDPGIATKDSDYVFLSFILGYLPHGLIGLLIAVILSAAMSSTSSELNALASTTAVDFYKRLYKTEGSDKHYLNASKGLTLLWGILAIMFAFIADSSENLIEAVNIIGSLFYGTILGIFLVAFFFKRVGGTAVFYAALIAEVVVIYCHYLNVSGIVKFGYLWYNVIGVVLTILLALVFELFNNKKTISG